LATPLTLKQKAQHFLRWRKAKGYPVAKRERMFWGRHAWRRKKQKKL
jgi:hypothetical protein